MVFTINIPKIDEKPKGPPPLVADRWLYLAADEYTLVEQGTAEAAFLLSRAGGTIAGVDVARLQLSLRDGRVAQACAEPTIEDLRDRFTKEVEAAGYSGNAVQSIVEGRLRHVALGGDGSQNIPAAASPEAGSTEPGSAEAAQGEVAGAQAEGAADPGNTGPGAGSPTTEPAEAPKSDANAKPGKGKR